MNCVIYSVILWHIMWAEVVLSWVFVFNYFYIGFGSDNGVVFEILVEDEVVS